MQTCSLLKPCLLVTLFWDQPTPQVPETDTPAPHQPTLCLDSAPVFQPQTFHHSASVSSPVEGHNEVCPDGHDNHSAGTC